MARSKIVDKLTDLSTRVDEFRKWVASTLAELGTEYGVAIGAISSVEGVSIASLKEQLTFLSRKLSRLQVSSNKLEADIEAKNVESNAEIIPRVTTLTQDAQRLQTILVETGGAHIARELEAATEHSTAVGVVRTQLERLRKKARAANAQSNAKCASLLGDVEDIQHEIALNPTDSPVLFENEGHTVIAELRRIEHTLQGMGENPFSLYTLSPADVLAAHDTQGKETVESLAAYKKEYDSAETELSLLMTRLSRMTFVDNKHVPRSAEETIAEKIVRASVKNQPKLAFFELKPPPSIPNVKTVTITGLQQFVLKHYDRFRWVLPQGVQMGCTQTKFATATPWQKFVYHYFHPFQEQVPGMLLAASAGAGKSWTIAMLSSVWLRAGRRVAVITKNTLRSEITAAMFKYRADLNINNLIAGEGVEWGDVPMSAKSTLGVKQRTKKALATKVTVGESNNRDDDDDDDDNIKGSSSESEEERIRRRLMKRIKAAHTSTSTTRSNDVEDEILKHMEAQGFAALKQMGCRWVHPLSGLGIMSLGQINNLIKSKGMRTFVEQGAPEDFPLEGALVQIDEAHLVVTGMGECRGISYPELRDELFRHRKDRPVSKWPRIALHTATPVASYACDVIKLLNLLVAPENAWLDFSRGNDNDLEATNNNFLNMYVNDDGTLNAGGMTEWNKLAAGCISYISMYGDRAHFAQTISDVNTTTVRLSLSQSKSALACLSCTSNVPTTSRSKKSRSKKGAAATRKTKKTEGEEEQEGEEKESETEKTQECVLTQILSPSANRGKTESVRDYATAHAPNVLGLVDGLAANDTKDRKEFAELVNVARSRGLPVASFRMANKIFLYITSKRPKATKMIFELLEDHGYHCLNPVINKTMKIDETKRPYSYYINHTQNMPTAFKSPSATYNEFDGERWPTALRGIFNAKNNFDGKNALIFISSPHYREGISLFGVSKIYVAGTETTVANLIQGVARAVRYCSSVGLPWVEGRGWKVDVYLQKLLWNAAVREDPEAKQKLEESVTDMLRSANPAGKKFYLAITEMQKLVQKTAVDALLFKDINASGESQIKLV